MGFELNDQVRGFIAGQPVGVLGTTRRDGTIRLSVVYHLLEGDRIVVSTVADRGKAHDVRRDGRASYAVFGREKPFPQVVVEGPARIVTAGIGATTSRLFEKISGSPPASELTDAMLAGMKRVILELSIERVRDVSYLPGPA